MAHHAGSADLHCELTRRYFLGLGAAGIAGWLISPLRADDVLPTDALAKAIAELSYLTRPDDFGTVERGNPLPYTLPEDKRRELGLERETWTLEVLADPDSNAKVDNPLDKSLGTAFDWNGLMQLAETHAVRFLKVMTCNNGDSPLGMGLWEGVPLREVIWKAKPVNNIRRVFYHGHHNEDPKQLFQSSLPVGRVLEEGPGEHPVILCYKLNGEWLSGKRGGPVRMLVPEAYGFKSVKWLKRVILTNEPFANDTYAKGNNDVDSRMKTFARFLSRPFKVKAGQPIPVTGVAQVGISGIKKVQYWLHPEDEKWSEDDPYFSTAPWQDAQMLEPPKQWGGGLPDDKLPAETQQFQTETGQPEHWPLRYTIVHWAALLQDIPAGRYLLRCRTIDAQGIAQPMPRPFPKSGRNSIAQVPLIIEG